MFSKSSESALNLPGQRMSFTLWYKNFATKLSRMTPEMQLIAEKLINDELYQGLSGKLTTQTELKDSSTPYPFSYVSSLTPLQMSVKDESFQGQQQNTMRYM